MINCRKCGIILNTDNWCNSHRKHHKYICKQCAAKQKREYRQRNLEKYRSQQRQWYAKNPGYRKIQNKKYYLSHKNDKTYLKRKHDTGIRCRRRIKTEAMNKLGGTRCQRCGTLRLDLLEVNHINGDGGGWRRKLGGGHMYLAILRNEIDLTRLNVLCKACNGVDFVERKYSVRYEIKLIPEQAELFTKMLEYNKRSKG